MLKMISKKTVMLVVVVVAGLAVMGVLLASMQTSLSLEGYQEEMLREAEELPGQIQDAADATQQNKDQFDAVYQQKAASVAYMANNNAGFEATDEKMTEYQELLNVDNVLVVSREGEVLAQAQDTQADFSHARFNLLRTVFDDGEPSEAVDVMLPDDGWDMRYYAAMIDDATMVVIEQSPAELDALVEESGSVASAIKNVTIGQEGYTFAVSALDYTFDYHPDSTLIGADAMDAGVDAADLEDGTFAWMTVGGERLYCYVVHIDDEYYVSAVPESEMTQARNITVGVTLFAFFAVMLLVALYGIFVARDHERRGDEAEDCIELGRNWRFNKAVARKAAILTLVGFVGVVAVSFYMQTLFALSSETLSNKERVSEIQSTIERTTEQATELSEQYSARNLSNAQVAAYIVGHNPELENRTDLKALANVLGVEGIFVFDSAGVMTATSTSYSNFTLSEDPEDQSYEFRSLLQGVEYVVQEPRAEEVSGELRQYIGVCLYDETGEADGFVQISLHPARLEALVNSVEIDNVLDGVKVGTDGFAFAVSREDNTLAYYPDSRYQGADALSVGMTENQLKDGFNDYVTIGGETYYASSVATDDYYLYAAGTEGELMAERVPLTLATGAVALVCQVLIFIILAFERVGGLETARRAEDKDDEDERVVNVTMPSGRVVRTESAAGRWLPRALDWDEKTPEQKLATVVKFLVGFFVVVVFLAVVFRERVFGADSLFSYILGGEWERGVNVFAITASIMFACVAMTVAAAIQWLLNLLSTVLAARGETVCRMLGSFIKYATIIGMVYYCLLLIGIDGTTLLASAGILSIAISLGAKELVSDILSGLFVIFEGEFRVGDIITVGSWRGTVIEIGVRSTKVDDGGGNVKIIRNSDMSNVVNMTKELSFASCDVGIEYGESLERVESILSKELPFIRKRLPAIVDGPFYKGVVSLGDNSVNIRIMVKCREADRVQLERDLNREMKLMFDKHDISIPFPQVVINQPVEYLKATEAEKRAADAFNEEQKEASKKLGNENEDASDESRDR